MEGILGKQEAAEIKGGCLIKECVHTHTNMHAENTVQSHLYAECIRKTHCIIPPLDSYAPLQTCAPLEIEELSLSLSLSLSHTHTPTHTHARRPVQIHLRLLEAYEHSASVKSPIT